MTSEADFRVIAVTAPGISYERIGSLSGSELTTLLADQFTAFNTPAPQLLIPPVLTRGVTLYRFFYDRYREPEILKVTDRLWAADDSKEG